MQSLQEGLSVIAICGNASLSPWVKVKQCDGPWGRSKSQGEYANHAVEEREDNNVTLPGLHPPHCYSCRQGCGGE